MVLLCCLFCFCLRVSLDVVVFYCCWKCVFVIVYMLLLIAVVLYVACRFDLCCVCFMCFLFMILYCFCWCCFVLCVLCWCFCLIICLFVCLFVCCSPECVLFKFYCVLRVLHLQCNISNLGARFWLLDVYFRRVYAPGNDRRSLLKNRTNNEPNEYEPD